MKGGVGGERWKGGEESGREGEGRGGSEVNAAEEQVEVAAQVCG